MKTATSPNGKFGLWHTQEKFWVGNDAGPLRYDDEELARAAATIFNKMLKPKPPARNSWGIVRARLFDNQPVHDAGKFETRYDGLEALQKIEAECQL